MKFISKLKAFVWIIAGGITGAVAFISVSVVLVLFISGVGVALPFIGHPIEKWTGEWTLEGTYTVFAAAGCVGFILGIIAGNRYLKKIQKWFSAAIVLGIPMILCLWLIYACAGGVQIPRSIKLADCTNSVANIHLKVPKGRYYRLVLAVPLGSTNTFLGRINISDGTSIVTNIPIGFNQTDQQCNFLHAQSNYDIEITFDQIPPSSTSVWLHWLQAYKDREK